MSFRIEEKLLINKYQLSQFKEYLASKGAIKIFKTRKINNLYFDNNKFDMFNDSIEGCLPRKKIRLRSYEDERIFLEIKISSTEIRFCCGYRHKKHCFWNAYMCTKLFSFFLRYLL